ncbi:unnamed protein product [Prunus armeniaca]|uniref:ERCC4 domain-containing protein n=1 Tax=Prunus armeniaca TaxID=36596 RepID=A0A6J5WG65_PRUAR|nr:unnamed protein product [Prunus armeniaca]
MSEPIILSDEEDQNALSTPFQPFHCKKRRTQLDPNPIPTVLVLDDDPTPQKQPGPTSTPDFVPETPMSDLAIVKCTKAPSHFQARVSDSEHKFPDGNWEIGQSLKMGKIEEEVIRFYKRVYTKEENTTWLERPFQDDEMMKAIWDCCEDSHSVPMVFLQQFIQCCTVLMVDLMKFLRNLIEVGLSMRSLMKRTFALFQRKWMHASLERFCIKLVQDYLEGFGSEIEASIRGYNFVLVKKLLLKEILLKEGRYQRFGIKLVQDHLEGFGSEIEGSLKGYNFLMFKELWLKKGRYQRAAGASLPRRLFVGSFYKGIRSPGVNGLICLESDNEPESGHARKKGKEIESIASGCDVVKDLDWRFSFVESTSSLGDAELAHMSEGNFSQSTLQDDIDQEADVEQPVENRMDQMGNILKQRRTTAVTDKENITKEATGRRKLTKEERTRLMEEKKLKKIQEKLQREALKAEAAEMKKIQKEKQKWEKGKFALKSIVAEIDSKVVELGSVGGNLLTRFAEKGLTYRITSNPIERSIVWTMTVPEHISQDFMNVSLTDTLHLTISEACPA